MAGKRNKQVPLWLSEDEEKSVEEAADSQGITKQQYIRFLIRRDRGMPCPGGPVH